MFDDMTTARTASGLSGVERRIRAFLDAHANTPVVQSVPAPFVVIVDLDTRRHAQPGPAADVDDEPLGPEARLLEAGAGHLDAVAELERVMARAVAAQVRELASFARCRPSAWDRQPGETGAASSASRAARPVALEPVSEWAAAEAAARLQLPQRAASTRLREAVFLVDQLPATLAALEAGHLTPAHARALVDLLEPVSDDKRAEVEAAALERAGSQNVDNMRVRVRRLIAKHDAAAALRRLVTAAKGRKVALYGDDDGMATLSAHMPAPLARASYQTLKAYAKNCEFDQEGTRDPRSLDERMLDCLADLILRPHGDRQPVQVTLTIVAGVDTLTGFGPGADEPGEVNGDLVPAALVRELAHTFGLMPRPAPTAVPSPVERGSDSLAETGADDDGSADLSQAVPLLPDDDLPARPSPDSPTPPADDMSVDWSQTAPTPGDAELEERIAELRAAERAAAEVAASNDAEDPSADADTVAAQPSHADVITRTAALRAQRKDALDRLLAATRLTGTALARRPHIAVVDQLSGTLLALTDGVELRQAATAGRGLGPPPATDAYEPTDPLARFVRFRDRRCRFPGCRARAQCADLDHQNPHPHGPTAHDNLACLCEHHHRLSHQAPGWRLRRDERGGLVWTLPGGHTVTTYPPAVGIDDAPATVAAPAPATRVERRRPRSPTLEALLAWRPGRGAPDPDVPF